MQTNWDLTKIYQTKEQIEKDIEKIKENIKKYEKQKENLDLNTILPIVEETSITLSRLYAYSNMKRDENSTIPESQKLVLEIEQLNAKVGEEFSDLNPNIMAMPEEEINKFLETTTKKDYKQYVEKLLRHKPHILNKEQEKILSIASDIFQDAENSYYMLSYADMKFPVIENAKDKPQLTHANYINFQTDKNREVRKEAFEKMHGTYNDYINTFAATYYGHVKATEKLAKVRNFNSCLEEELFDDKIPVEVYDNLIDAVHQYIPALSEYMQIKKDGLNIDKVHNYDLYANIIEKDETKYTYEEAQEIIKNALKPMGDEYLSILDKAFKDRWIDVYPKEGKKSGAYSFGSYDTNPYILTNFTGNLNSVFTLAHELGHSIHSYYSRKNNPYFQSNYTIFVAEVASTTNELLLYNYMLKNAKTKEQKNNLIIYNLEQFRTTVFRQTMFAEFEKIVHGEIEKGNPLTAENLNEIYYDLNKTYYPTIEVDDLIKVEWARIPHFYSDYYVYKYATGFSCASFLSQKILEDSKNVEKYINFLKDGSKHYPIEQLQMAGVDISKKETVMKALDLFKNSIKQFQ